MIKNIKLEMAGVALICAALLSNLQAADETTEKEVAAPSESAINSSAESANVASTEESLAAELDETEEESAPKQVTEADQLAAKKQIDDVISATTLEQQQVLIEAQNEFKQGNDAYLAGNYEDAIKKYLEAAKILKLRGLQGSQVVKEQLNACRGQISASYRQIANKKYIQAVKSSSLVDIDDAIKNCRLALEITPDNKSELQVYLDNLLKIRTVIEEERELKPEFINPNIKATQEQVSIILHQGKNLYLAGKYIDARSKFTEAIDLDPYNTEAVQCLKAANIKISEAGYDRYKNVHKNMIDGVVEAWAQPTSGLQFRLDDDFEQISKEESSASVELNKKLDSIIIPEISFEGVTLQVAIDYLKELAKKEDPEQVGVNIRYTERGPEVSLSVTPEGGRVPGGRVPGGRVPPRGIDGTTTTTVRPPMPRGVPGARTGDGDFTATTANQQNTFGDDNTWGDVGGFGDDGMGVNEEFGTLANNPEIDNLLQQPKNDVKVTIKLQGQSVRSAIKEICDAANLKYRIMDGLVYIAPANIVLDEMIVRRIPIDPMVLRMGDDAGEDGLKQMLIDRGHEFPEGSSVHLNEMYGMLSVTNTPENIKKLEDYIAAEMTFQAPMVVIQTKFVEISQNDLKELGFAYSFSNSKSGMGTLEFGPTEMPLRGLAGVDDKIFIFNKTGGDFSYQFAVRALNQLDSSDVLASPKVMVLSGEYAFIKMVTEEYFVSEYGEPEYITGGSENWGDVTVQRYAYKGGMPEFDDSEEVGISLEVQPDADINTRRITLVLGGDSCRINSIVGWTVYEYTIDGEDFEPLPGEPPRTEQRIYPVISERSIQTTVTVEDGGTIVLGGVIKDTSTIIDDKVPVLGDIPLIGRFFTSQAVDNKKTNLLIFLTCRLVKPDGTAYFEPKPDGLPDFGRWR